MKNAAHLDAEQFGRYQAGTMDAAELLAVDGHLAECAACRNALYDQSGAGAQLNGLRFDLSEHLAYDQVVACAEDRCTDPAVNAHLGECAQCRAEVGDLRQFRKLIAKAPGTREIRRPRPMPVWTMWAAAAAVVVLAAGLVRWKAQDTGQPVSPTVAQHPAKSSGPELTPAQQQAVQLALTAGKLDRAPVLDRLIAHRGVLLGDSTEPGTFDLIAPVGTAVISDRPTFRWQPVRGATKYMVSIFDENFTRVAESPEIGITEWQAAQPLPRGRIYVWQVKATVGGQIVRAPVPPAPEARFQISNADAAGEIGKARQDHSGNHLLLAVMLSRYGALDEAAAELDALSAIDPATAQTLRDSLARIRKQ